MTRGNKHESIHLNVHSENNFCNSLQERNKSWEGATQKKAGIFAGWEGNYWPDGFQYCIQLQHMISTS